MCRFLEYLAIRKLGKEKDELWNKLRGGGVRVRHPVEMEDDEVPVSPGELNEEEKVELRRRIREGLYKQKGK
jgi:hypothetical protein